VKGLLLEEIASAVATATEGTTTGTMESMDKFMSGFMVIIGLFALYSAFTGKGPAFKNDYPKAMQAEANKMMRTFLWIIAPVITILGVLDYMKDQWGTDWAYWVSLCFTLPAIVVYFILFRRKFKQYLKK
jgi:hypothetical protein